MTDAMSVWLCTAEDEGITIPEPTPQHLIEHSENAVLSLIKADTLLYRSLTETKAMRKNVSLPAWLYRAAEKKRINCSQVLQDALLTMI